MKVEDVIIIGAGPAGLTTALQLKRYGLSPLLLEKDAVGGLLRNANLVENYPGFPGGISGLDLVELFQVQAKQTSVQVTQTNVLEVAYEDTLFRVRTVDHQFSSPIVVIASGTKPKTFEDPKISEKLLSKISYEVYALRNVVDKHIAIIGAGDAAFDYALNLAKKNRVTILNRGHTRKCLPLLWERSSSTNSIRYLPGTKVAQVEDNPEQGLSLLCQDISGSFHLYADYLVGAIGREAELGFLSSQLQVNLPELEAKGILYQVGDVKNGHYRQTAIAVGEGLRAAMKIYQQFEEHSS